MAKKAMSNIRAVLEVSRKEYITPHLIRVYLTGDMVYRFDNTTVGINNKIVVPPKGLNEIHFPEMDPETRTWKPMDESVRPSIRTYTHRGIDLEKNEIWVDFVAHGDEGPASAWAIDCKKGDVLGVMMHDRKAELYPEADEYTLVGDATAIPVISAILEDLPSTAKGHCVLEVHGPEDELNIDTKADIQMHWVHNPHPEKGSNLADKVKSLPVPEGNKFAYVACEFDTVKQLRHYFRKELNWSNKELYAYSYWKSGVAEDRSTQDRRQEKSSMDEV